MVVVAGYDPIKMVDIPLDELKAIGRTVMPPPADPGTGPLSALHVACRDGDAEQVQQLLKEEDASKVLEKFAKFGWTPLMFAARNGHAAICTELVFAGARLDARDHSGACALHLAALKGSVKTIEALLDLGSSIDPTNKMGQTPLHVAAMNGCLPAAKCLLKRGCSPKSKDGPLCDGMLPEEVALSFHEYEMADFLKKTLRQFYVDVQRASVSSDPKAKAWLTLMMSSR